jgi:hypothetical protein
MRHLLHSHQLVVLEAEAEEINKIPLKVEEAIL